MQTAGATELAKRINATQDAAKLEEENLHLRARLNELKERLENPKGVNEHKDKQDKDEINPELQPLKESTAPNAEQPSRMQAQSEWTKVVERKARRQTRKREAHGNAPFSLLHRPRKGQNQRRQVPLEEQQSLLQRPREVHLNIPK
ncbi:hypothetical protein K0M31_007130 [Melipona bicolor]|uniref:Uncharacterized protein n=1 Tax=Melipona bicolor TaxID=60889 RepID=A0AA40KKT2_9HYME|nr:hypothetical protein K0M31_007130 [Melipona bicolor]